MPSGIVAGVDTGTGSALANGGLKPTKTEKVEKVLVGNYELSVEIVTYMYNPLL